MTALGPEPTARPRRRRPGTVVLAVAAVAMALLIGIPVGVLTRPSADASAAPGLAPTIAADSSPGVAPPPATAVQEPVQAAVPANLSDAEQAVWNELPMPGAARSTCAGYPQGEAIPGVEAALTCQLEDGSMTQPIIYYQFTDSTAMNAYMQMRAQPITHPGSCSDGNEYSGVWTGSDGATRGNIVCVDNPKNGTTYFKMIWTGISGETAAVIQEPSASTTWAWWLAHGGEQFSS